MRCYSYGEYDHFAQECCNMPTDDEMGHSDSEEASLQMLTQDNLPLNSKGKDDTTSFLQIESKTSEK